MSGLWLDNVKKVLAFTLDGFLVLFKCSVIQLPLNFADAQSARRYFRYYHCEVVRFLTAVACKNEISLVADLNQPTASH